MVPSAGDVRNHALWVHTDCKHGLAIFIQGIIFSFLLRNIFKTFFKQEIETSILPCITLIVALLFGHAPVCIIFVFTCLLCVLDGDHLVVTMPIGFFLGIFLFLLLSFKIYGVKLFNQILSGIVLEQVSKLACDFLWCLSLQTFYWACFLFKCFE